MINKMKIEVEVWLEWRCDVQSIPVIWVGDHLGYSLFPCFSIPRVSEPRWYTNTILSENKFLGIYSWYWCSFSYSEIVLMDHNSLFCLSYPLTLLPHYLRTAVICVFDVMTCFAISIKFIPTSTLSYWCMP